jgi:hypothetical protein
MRTVWNELQRQRRDKTGFVNPARGGGDLQLEQDRQQQAMSMFFTFVVGCLHPALKVRTRTDVEAEKRHWLRAVKELRKIATNILVFAPERSQEINATANALQAEFGVKFQSGVGMTIDAMIVERSRRNPNLRGFVRKVADICRMFFGSPLYSTIATITNVVFDQNGLTGVHIRTLIRG